MRIQIYRLTLLFVMAALVREGSGAAMSSGNHNMWARLQHPTMVKRSTNGQMRDILTENVMTTNDRKRHKRQYYPPYPGYYNPVYSGSYYYPPYPGFYNPVGTGSLWAAGGGLVGNTLSFILGK